MKLFEFLGVLSPAHINIFNWLNAKEQVGQDEYGNRYYRGKARKGYKRERRWVMYNGEAEASLVPPEWHGWLHHQSNEVPGQAQLSYRRNWQKPYLPNMTGTTAAYRPPGHLAESGQRAKATGDYEAWTPPKDLYFKGFKEDKIMKRSVFETLLGAAIIIVAGLFFYHSYTTADVGPTTNGYEVSANFSTIGGLKTGDAVQISGVKVGTVSGVELDQTTYLAKVSMMIDSAIELPLDTAAKISSEGLLGGVYMALEPGGDPDLLEDGDSIQYTQAPQNLEELLGKFIFSMSENKESE
jgi:phospholipid/cholesterol/gamma-HCH transport system substrate-binding protein